MVSLSFLAASAIYFTGIIALDYSQTTTLTETVSQYAQVTVEAEGDVTINDQAQLDLVALTVNQGGQFYYSTTDQSADIEIDTIINNGFIYFDTSAVKSTGVGIGANFENNGEVVFNGYDTAITLGSNTGSLTFWGNNQAGTLSLAQGVNTGNICFYQTISFYQNPDGSGCIALNQAQAFHDAPQSNFNPTVVFEGFSSAFNILSGGEDASYTLVQFGGADSVTVIDGGFTGHTYDPTAGILTILQTGYQVTLNIGTGYSPGLISVTTDGAYVTFFYGAAVPAGANTGGCTCVLDTSPPPDLRKGNDNGNGDGKNPGNNNNGNGHSPGGNNNDNGNKNNNGNGNNPGNVGPPNSGKQSNGDGKGNGHKRDVVSENSSSSISKSMFALFATSALCLALM
ncbi:hypothetical protein JA1_000372 [Spathaspora sp. JA1]|nr:hypothetical protein JA1_000372 [Spathaspora sp. JA1]